MMSDDRSAALYGGGNDSRVDYVVEMDGKQVCIEVKSL